MTPEQEATLRSLCKRYGVEFDPEHYTLGAFDLPDGYVSGWVGGPSGNPDLYEFAPGWNPDQTIYVGVSPEGDASS